MKLIDKDTLLAEIEKLKAYLQIPNAQLEAIKVCDNVISVIETLEVKDVDLEEKATQLSQKYFPNEENIWARPNIEAHKCKSACMEMIEWFNAQK